MEFTVNVAVGLSDRNMEAVDRAVAQLRDVPGVTVTGWCDDE